MRIYSAASYVDLTAETFYDLNLEQIGNDFWLAPTQIAEAAYLPTSTTEAGVFRQVTKYDETAIQKTYDGIILTAAQAVTLQAMDASTQVEWMVDAGTGLYRAVMTVGLSYVGGRPMATLTFRVLEKEA